MKIDEAVSTLIEKLRSVKWEVVDDDDWDSRCVFVDMRPDDFRALLEEAAAALEAAREEVVKLRNIRADAVHAAALANIRAIELEEALALLPDEIGMVEHNPDEGPCMFCCGGEVTPSWHRGPILTHNEGCWYERMRALRNHDQEDRND